MKSIKSSEFKAKLAKYLRMVRHGEELQILDRGVAIARVTGITTGGAFLTIPAEKPSKELAKLVSKVVNPPDEDVVALLQEDRSKR